MSPDRGEARNRRILHRVSAAFLQDFPLRDSMILRWTESRDDSLINELNYTMMLTIKMFFLY